jgi:hypothetical protein
MSLNRREFLSTVAGSIAATTVTSRAQVALEWGSAVFDPHFHLRQQPAANLARLDGAGITRANLLTRATGLEQVRAVQAAGPGRFVWFASADPSQQTGVDALTQAVKAAHAVLGR